MDDNETQIGVMDMTFLIISSILFTILIVLVPKRLNKIEIFASTFSALYLQVIVDIYLEIKLKWYYYLKEETIEWTAMFVAPIYAGVNILFLNFFPYGKSIIKKGLYITICVAISIIYEYAALQFKMISYNEWKLWYSAISYFFIFTLLALNLKWIRNLEKR